MVWCNTWKARARYLHRLCWGGAAAGRPLCSMSCAWACPTTLASQRGARIPGPVVEDPCPLVLAQLIAPDPSGGRRRREGRKDPTRPAASWLQPPGQALLVIDKNIFEDVRLAIHWKLSEIVSRSRNSAEKGIIRKIVKILFWSLVMMSGFLAEEIFECEPSLDVRSFSNDFPTSYT